VSSAELAEPVTGLPWSAAWRESLLGPSGLIATGQRPTDHFRTSLHVAPELIARAVLALDARLGTVLDIGAGGGQLTHAIAGSERRVIGVDLVERPLDLDPRALWFRGEAPGCLPELPVDLSEISLAIAHEWLDDVPLDVHQAHGGRWRQVHVDRQGRESLGADLGNTDQPDGTRYEDPASRVSAWRALRSLLPNATLVGVDYSRPQRFSATLTGYRQGRIVPAIPDGSCNITAHVDVDSLRNDRTTVMNQSAVFRALPPELPGVADGLDQLLANSARAELTDPAGLGAMTWWWETPPIASTT